MGNQTRCSRELSPAVEPGALVWGRGGACFKDFGHFHKIALGCMLPKVGEQVLELDTPGFHHNCTT